MTDINPLHAWVHSFPGMVSVCDTDGVILAMNDAALRASRVNVYTTEKNGVHKLVYQCPWHRDGQYAGLMEIVAEITAQMPHFIRKP